MSYYLKMFSVAVLLGLCFVAVRGIVQLELTSANRKLKEGNPETIICKTIPYQGQMYWKVDNDTVAKCISTYCTIMSNGSETYTFEFDVEKAVFRFTINRVTKDIGGQVIQCSDGVLPVNMTLEVQEVPEEVPEKSCASRPLF